MCKKNSLLQLQVQNHKKSFYSSELSVHERSIFPSVKHNWHFRESPTLSDSDLIRPEYTRPSGYLHSRERAYSVEYGKGNFKIKSFGSKCKCGQI